MTLVALDMNATRLRALHGTGSSDLVPLALDGAEAELPLALNLAGRYAAIGRIGLSVCRRSPHLTCVNFLPYLGQERVWTGARQSLDASGALSTVFDHLYSLCRRARGVALALPGYLLPDQRDLAVRLAEKSGVKCLVSINSVLAASWMAHAEFPWSGVGVVGSIDDYALTWTAVNTAGNKIRPIHTASITKLGLLAWKERLLQTLSDLCVRQTRRDPRDSADAEQYLYDQLDAVLDAWQGKRLAEVAICLPQLRQNLVLRAEDIEAVCAPLAELALAYFHDLVHDVEGDGVLRVVLLASPLARLPGLVTGIQTFLDQSAWPSEIKDADDFGVDLLREEARPASLRILPEDTVCRGTHELASMVQKGELKGKHLDAAPLPEPLPAEAGQPRLQFRGQEYFLGETPFTLGRAIDRNLVFDSVEYPSVSGEHCEIVLEYGCYFVRDHSRHGTLVNDDWVAEEHPLQPGDWIELSPGGPRVQFLGQASDRQKRITTA